MSREACESSEASWQTVRTDQHAYMPTPFVLRLTLAMLGLGAVMLMVTGCFGSSSRTVSDAGMSAETTIHDLRHVREMTFETTVAEPQADWSPAGAVLLTRGIKGIMIGREGYGSQHFRTDDAFSPWNPRWMDNGTIVYGPEPRPKRDETGEVVVPSQGLFVSEFTGGGLTPPAPLTSAGYLPQPWSDERVVMNLESQIIIVDKKGEEEFFGEGFYPVPQPNGFGIAWQETPVFIPDWWTGKDKTGNLVIRWQPGVVDMIPGGVQACWTPSGGVVATVIRAESKTGTWYEGGTDVVYLAGPGADPVVLMRDARDPHPHPIAPCVAVSGNDGRVYALSYGDPDQRLLADLGQRPRWSADGTRLAVQEPHPEEVDAAVIRVYIFAVRGTGDAELSEAEASVEVAGDQSEVDGQAAADAP